MARQRTGGFWFSALFGRSSGKPRPARRAPRRKLNAEWLESRMVLSTAPFAVSEGPSLADYLAQEHQMGPVVPAEMAASNVDANSAAAPHPFSPLAGAQGEGEDCTDPNDPTTCDGSGGDGTGGDGSGGDGSGGDGSGGDGSGGDGSGGDGSGGDPGTGDPQLDNVEIGGNEGTITIIGFLSDDGGAGNLTITVDNGIGDVQINDDGSFTLNITDPNGNSTFTILVTDADGNTTTYTFDYPI